LTFLGPPPFVSFSPFPLADCHLADADRVVGKGVKGGNSGRAAVCEGEDVFGQARRAGGQPASVHAGPAHALDL
jgi:hypothetical protein